MKTREYFCIVLAIVNIILFFIGSLPREHSRVKPVLTPHFSPSSDVAKERNSVRFLDVAEARQSRDGHSARYASQNTPLLKSAKDTPDTNAFKLIGQMRDGQGIHTYFLRESSGKRIIKLSSTTLSPNLLAENENSLQFQYEGQIYEVLR